MVSKKLLYAIGVTLLLLLLSVGESILQAQGPIQWSPQQRIPQYEDQTETPPFLIADQDFTVHVFNSQPLDLDQPNSPRAVLYRQWRPEQGWTDPVDIILNPGGDLNLLDVYEDNQGTTHLLIQMNQGTLYHVKASLALAGRASSWSRPILLDDQSNAITVGVPFLAAINGDGYEEIVVLYSGSRNGQGVYALRSTDQGNSWTLPTPVYLTGDNELLPVAPKLAMGGAGTMHAVWSTLNEDGSGGPGYYAQLEMGSGRWRNLIELDSPGIRTPNVIEYENEIIMTYYHHDENKNWWRKSSDGGQTWSDPALISQIHRGTNGFTSFVIDSANDLHLFFGQRIDDDNHGMWHTRWVGNGWAEITAVARGAQVRDETGGQGFDPHSARAVVINGNHILVTWVTDGFAGLNGGWYAQAVLDAPELPRLPLAELTPLSATVTPFSVGNAVADLAIPPETGMSDLANNEQPILNGRNERSSNPLFVSLIPVIALIAGVVAWRQLQQYRQQ